MPRIINQALFFALFAVLTASSTASAKNYKHTLQGVALNATVEKVQSLIANHCDSLELFEPETVQFPLAENTETHIVCTNFQTPDNQQIDELTLSFADGRLVMIKAAGGATSAELFNANEQTGSIAHLDIYDDMEIVLDPKNDTLWILNADAQHAHAFLWSFAPNEQADEQPEPQAADATIPAILVIGSKINPLTKELKALSQFTTRERITPPSLPTQPKRQTQINCYGFNYAGAPRKLEAVFADGKLAMVWILTAQAEEQRIHDALTAAYGSPVFTSDAVVAFNDWKVVLRKDKPEVLTISDELVPMMKSFMGG